jgi:hypothetical protein
MFLDYKKEVIKFYEKRLKEGDLPLGLQLHKPADLKKEWLNVMGENYIASHDDKLLREFFGPKEILADYERAIKTKGTDKCKPLSTFLEKNDVNAITNERNIELLSWLIKFEPRPHRVWEIKKEKSKILDHNEPKTLVGPEQNKPDIFLVSSKDVVLNYLDIKDQHLRKEKLEPIKNKAVEKEKIVKRTNSYLLIGIVILGILAFTIFSSKNWLNGFFGKKENQCMYWNIDQYQMINCEQKLPNIQVIALDTFKLNYFKKIDRIDTLTKNCIGRIWYSKIDNKVEFFTIDGIHPEHLDRPLKPVTSHIYEVYIEGLKK